MNRYQKIVGRCLKTLFRPKYCLANNY